jgi:hypothetical protein
VFEPAKDVHVDGVDSKQQETTMLLTLSRSLKAAAVAALLGAGLAGAGAISASAETIRTQCDGDGDCYRVRCDDFGNDCVNIGYVERANRPFRQRYVCDAYGDDCHWTRIYEYDRDYDDDYGY